MLEGVLNNSRDRKSVLHWANDAGQKAYYAPPICHHAYALAVYAYALGCRERICEIISIKVSAFRKNFDSWNISAIRYCLLHDVFDNYVLCTYVHHLQMDKSQNPFPFHWERACAFFGIWKESRSVIQYWKLLSMTSTCAFHMCRWFMPYSCKRWMVLIQCTGES